MRDEPSSAPRAAASASSRSSRSRAGAPSARASASSTSSAIPRNGSRPLEERRDGHLVRRVEDARACRRARPPRARAASSGNVSRSGASNSSVEPARGRAAAPASRALGIGERVRDRDAHVRVAEVRERGAVAEARRGVDDRGRVDDHLDPLVRQAEEEVRLDELEPLVRERCGVHCDLRPIARSDARAPRSGVTSSSSSRVRPRNGPPEAVRTSEWTVSGRRPSRHWNAAECSLSTGRSSALPHARGPPARARRRRRGSPCSRARASTPRSSAQSVARSPAKPTTAFRTTSGSARSSSSVRSPPTCVSGARPSIGCEPEAAATSSSSGFGSMISSAWRPIEPVAPSRATRFIDPGGARDDRVVAAGTAAKSSESIRSSTPPCPPSRRPCPSPACRA